MPTAPTIRDDEPRYVALGERSDWLRARARQPRTPWPPVLIDGLFGEAVSRQPGWFTLRMQDGSEVVVTRAQYDAAHAAALAELAALEDHFAADGRP